ncbi:hypothetical protein BH18ACI4_BH18ACI4_21900 [soil metagenome]
MHFLSNAEPPNPHGSVAQGKSEIDNSIELLMKLARRFLVEVGSLSMLESRDIKRGLDFYEEVRRFEISLIERALVQTAGHQRRAAQLLGLGPTTLNAKMKQYDINSATHPLDHSHKTKSETDLTSTSKSC